MEVHLIFINGTSYKCGKDTAAAMIAEELNQKYRGHLKEFHRIAFSFKLKKLVSELTGVPLQKEVNEAYTYPFYDFTQEQKDTFLPLWQMTLGRILQVFATEALRDNFDEDIWVKGLEQHIINQTTDKVVQKVFFLIPDWRFPNEKKLGEFLLNKANYQITKHFVKVHRDVPEEELKGRDINHSSENSLKGVDCYQIDNNSTLEQLRINCKNYVESEF